MSFAVLLAREAENRLLWGLAKAHRVLCVEFR